MTYYNDYEYNERYFVRFKDIDNNDWRISIQDPLFDGTAIELTGSASPVEWEGDGDEKQDNVMCGSTGRISLICLDGQESIFTLGNLLPEMINDRRVQVLRYTNIGNNEYIWAEYWQGFIKPDIYTQDWDRTPYEIELPIVSAVSSMEFFPLPDSIEGTPFEDVTNIAGLLRAVCLCCGCDIRNILTNKPVYEDFNGEPQLVPGQSYNAHWTQGVVSASYYYDISDGIAKPKTFKKVLENICYPYGKIHDVYRGIAILMRWKNDANDNARIYALPIWEDYENQVISEAVRFSDDGTINSITLADIDTAGTDNSFSLISRPRSVKFSKNINTENDIFELTDKFIKPSLVIGDNLTGKEGYEDPGQLQSGFRRYLYAFDKQYVNTNFAYDWVFSNTRYQDNPKLQDFAFCRTVALTGQTNDISYSTEVPLGFSFNVNKVSGSSNVGASVYFTLVNGVRSIDGANEIKLSIKPYVINRKDPAYTYQDGSNVVSMSLVVEDVTTSKYLIKTNNGWVWSSIGQQIQFSDLTNNSGEYSLSFNEERSANDHDLHHLRFGLHCSTTGALSSNTFGRMFCTFKLEYQQCKTATNQGIAATFAKSIESNGTTTNYGGSGEDLTIGFETQCGTKNVVIDGSIMLPYNSFCNAQTYIDTQNREKIEIGAVKFERYNPTGIQMFDFVSGYVVVKDEAKVYIPVAVGMNPRMNTVKLRLVSTNVTSS